MEAQERTRQKLAAAIKEEMEHTSLDKITVTQIVEGSPGRPSTATLRTSTTW